MAKSGTYFIYGRHAVVAALANSGRSAVRLLVTEKPDEALLKAALEKKLKPQTVSANEFERLLPRDAVAQGLALEVEPLRDQGIESLSPIADQKNLVLVLDQVTDPHNVGAMFRSAAAFGVRAVLTQERHAPEESGVLAKAASGALDIVPWVRVINLSRALDELFEQGYWRVGLDGAAQKTISEIDLGDNLVLVLGAEGPGLRHLTREKCDLLVKIPVSAAIDSLNVSNAAAVALYELIRK